LDTPSRLGFAVKVVGKPGLKETDSRRWQSGPHLRVSLGYLDGIFDYLGAQRLRMYRISSDIAPYVTHPDLPQFHNQIDECRDELAQLGVKARRIDVRLSMHPSQYIVLNAVDGRVARAAVADFTYHADFLDALGCGPEAKIITHVGGVYGDRAAAATRFAERYRTLPDRVRARLVLENDDVSWGVPDILAIHAETGIPLVFDILHHRVNNPGHLSEVDACTACLETWPAEVTPKIHYSTQRTVNRDVTQKDRASGNRVTVSQPPKPGQHDDWIDPVDFLWFMDAMGHARFDVMLEAKRKDEAVLRLREAIAAAGLQARFW
jgi:UV DNA damage endonuclease